MTASPPIRRVAVLIPVYRDWAAARIVCRQLDESLAQEPDSEVHVWLVDDGSPDGRAGWEPLSASRLSSIRTLVLRRNVGHQRAIAIGLCHLYEHFPCDAVLVMDADGEDRPADAVRLLRELRQTPNTVVFAERRRRMENFTFRAGYVAYRLLHYSLTGIAVRVGNFSVLPSAALPRLVCMSELWNHYAGAVFKSRFPYHMIPIDRGTRSHGQSHMNLIGLVVHGLSGIATFHEVVATRILLVSLMGLSVLLLGLLGVVATRVLTNTAIPGWATFSAGLLLVLATQIVAISFSLVFIFVSSRMTSNFLPLRDCALFVERTERI